MANDYYRKKEPTVKARNLHLVEGDLVMCGQCANFIRYPDSSPQAFGQCQPFEAFKAKGATESELKIAELRLGNNPVGGPKQFYPGHEPYRRCIKYIKSDV